MKQIYINNDKYQDMTTLNEICKKAQEASYETASATTEQKNNILKLAAKLIIENQDKILIANKDDIAAAKAKKLSSAMIDRLALNHDRINAISAAILAIMDLADPVGKVIWENDRPNGLKIKRVTVPLGLLAVIYESRPNVTADAFALCLKSGNAVILKPGSESFATSKIIFQLLQQAVEEGGLPKYAISIVPDNSREMVDQLLTMDQYIDVVVPRGGKNLIKKVASTSKIPVFKHLDGNCHIYIHESADLELAKNVLFNAKLRRPGICGATESVVIDEKLLPQANKIFDDLNEAGCEIRGDKQICSNLDYAILADDTDYGKEYLDKIISVKIVNNSESAINHINKYGSSHTDCIIATNENDINKFLQKIDSAIVMVNSSTQFADGGEFGLGAEIGIATGKLHARGPVGLDQLVTYKYHVIGNGQIRK
ncbi:MAG: glutamate-5-semialdehyde dehydrogenase [Rickettsiales bacterium]|nr:glutamate-5-semialdehyde dehydrogenase [Rickettsiales bacterium]